MAFEQLPRLEQERILRPLLAHLAHREQRTDGHLYEVPRGLDERLVDRPADWQADMRAKVEHYSRLAEGVL